MPTDTRRITGPEETKSPHIYVKSSETSLKQQVSISFTQPQIPPETRNDKRAFDEVRPIFLKAGVVSQARGSAYIEQNDTKVICAIYGPREVGRREEFSMKGILNCEFKYATFSCQYRRQYQQDSEEKDLSVQLLDALEPAVCLHKFPKAQVDVFVTVLQNDGSALAASITCASVALANAGIEMYDLVAGTSARLTDKLVLMDPTEKEEYKAQESDCVNEGSLTVGLMPSLNQISAITSKGEIEFETIKQAMNQCVKNCQDLYPVMQACLNQATMDKLSDQLANT